MGANCNGIVMFSFALLTKKEEIAKIDLKHRSLNI